MSNSAITSASDIQMDYMLLLTTQLQNQNPLEPMDNAEMASQLAQFSQLAQTEQLNLNFEKVLANSQREYATSLLGKEVTFFVKDNFGFQNVLTGRVDKVSEGTGGDILLEVGDYLLKLNEIMSVE
ncbi:MAG: hypothetical protein K8R02_04520 [Anaerohalosphaeraceae bacterium]|nr:hypothetical protein [Anaerohalosphaeraceae bacterium]